MARWVDLEATEPEVAQLVRQRFEAQRHSTLATLRKDGSPRICGTEVQFVDGDVVLDMMPNSLKARDLRRDPRLALHSPSEDASEQSNWAGDAKLAGRAAPMPDAGHPSQPANRFQIELSEVVLTRIGTPPDHLVIKSWHADRGIQLHERG